MQPTAIAGRSRYLRNATTPAFSGLAVRYISLYEEQGLVRREEYLAGLWRQTFAQGLAWSLEVAKSPSHNQWSIPPRWSWASVPLCSDIITQPEFESVDEFKLLEKLNLGKEGRIDEPLEVVKRGASVRSVRVRGLFRRLLQERKDWEVIRAKNGQKDAFDFSRCIDEFVHSQNLKIGRIVASEPHNKIISSPRLGTIHCIPWDSDMKSMCCLKIGKSSMLLLMKNSVAGRIEADGERDEGRKEGKLDVSTGRDLQHGSAIVLCFGGAKDARSYMNENVNFVEKKKRTDDG